MNSLIFLFKIIFIIFSGVALYGATQHIWFVAFSFTLFAGFMADILYINYYIDNHKHLPKFSFTFPITLVLYTVMSFLAFVMMIMNGVTSLIFLTAVGFILGLVLLVASNLHIYSKKS